MVNLIAPTLVKVAPLPAPTEKLENGTNTCCVVLPVGGSGNRDRGRRPIAAVGIDRQLDRAGVVGPQSQFDARAGPGTGKVEMIQALRIPQHARRSRVAAGGLALPDDLPGADGAEAGGKVQGVRRGAIRAQRHRAVGRSELDEHVAGAADGLAGRGVGSARGATRIGGAGRLHGGAEGVDDYSGRARQGGVGDLHQRDVLARGQHVTSGRQLFDEVVPGRQAGETVLAGGVRRGGAHQGVRRRRRC